MFTSLLVLLLIAFTFFCNGWILHELIDEAEEEGVDVYEKWDEIVEREQGEGVGARLMKIYYFIPSVVAYIDRRWNVNW